jgi:hypothetical protein
MIARIVNKCRPWSRSITRDEPDADFSGDRPDPRVVEVIASKNLREFYELRDGSLVEVQLSPRSERDDADASRANG